MPTTTPSVSASMPEESASTSAMLLRLPWAPSWVMVTMAVRVAEAVNLMVAVLFLPSFLAAFTVMVTGSLEALPERGDTSIPSTSLPIISADQSLVAFNSNVLVSPSAERVTSETSAFKEAGPRTSSSSPQEVIADAITADMAR